MCLINYGAVTLYDATSSLQSAYYVRDGAAVAGVVRYGDYISILVKMAREGESVGSSTSQLRGHTEMQLTEYFSRLFGMRDESHTGSIKPSTFMALVDYSGVQFSASEMAAIAKDILREVGGA